MIRNPFSKKQENKKESSENLYSHPPSRLVASPPQSHKNVTFEGPKFSYSHRHYLKSSPEKNEISSHFHPPLPQNPPPLSMPISKRPPLPLPYEIGQATSWEDVRQPEKPPEFKPILQTDLPSTKEYRRNSFFDSNFDEDFEEEEDNVYSYAGEDIISPALAIRAQALFGDDDNIYEEIPDFWAQMKNRQDYDRIQGRRVLSALNINVDGFTEFYKKQAHIDSFGRHDSFSQYDSGSYSPDSGLTASASASDSSGDLQRSFIRKRNELQRMHPMHRPKLKRCESLDMKNIAGKRPKIRSEIRKSAAEKKRKNSIKRRLVDVRDKMEKTKSKLIMNFAKRGKSLKALKSA